MRAGLATGLVELAANEEDALMADKTGIQWTEATWNPLRGCTRVSEGCRNCYAESVAARFSGPGMPYEGLAEMTPSGPRWTNTIRLMDDAILEQPLRWKRPRRIFVNSMSDLFHKDVPFGFIDKVFGVMALAPQHTFQILTKRPERMLEYMTTLRRDVFVWIEMYNVRPTPVLLRTPPTWPLRNVWLGVSTEDQKTADARIPYLLKTPAAVRFLSCEPLLGPISFRPQAVDGLDMLRLMESGDAFQPTMLRGISWVISGGESGTNARPMHPDWARSLRDQCQAAGVAFFHKQHGEYASPSQFDASGYDDVLANERGVTIWADGRIEPGQHGTVLDGSEVLWRVGKKRAGRMLDDREWSEYPEVPT